MRTAAILAVLIVIALRWEFTRAETPAPSTTCFADLNHTGQFDTPCVFPFVYLGVLFDSCTDVNNNNVLWCPTSVSSDGSYDVTLIGNCQCAVTEPVQEPVPVIPTPTSSKAPSTPAGPVAQNWTGCENGIATLSDHTGMFGYNSSAPSNNSNPTVNCSWMVVSDLTESTEVPVSTILVVLQAFPLNHVSQDTDADLKIFNGSVARSNNVLLSRSLHILNGSLGAVVTSDKALINFHSQLGSPRDRHGSFLASYYVDFCVRPGPYFFPMELPGYKVWSDPSIPLFSNDYGASLAKSPRPYANNASCFWEMLKPPKHNKEYTIVFYRFDLGDGDSVKIFQLDPNHGFSRSYSNKEGIHPIRIRNTSQIGLWFIANDDNSVGTGFEADVLEDTCGSRPIVVTQLMGSIDDGTAPSTLYHRNLNCAWEFKPINWVPGAYVEIVFNYISIGPDDSFTITDYTGAVLLLFTGANATKDAPFTLKVESSEFRLEFYSSDGPQDWFNTQTYAGFSLNWTTCTGECLACAPGTYFDANYPFSRKCRPCNQPNITSGKGMLHCEPCPLGSVWNSSSSCSTCGLDHFFDNQSLTCVACPAHTIANSTNIGTACILCPENSIANHISHKCIACDEGSMRRANEDACDVIPVPHNNEVLIVFLLVGLLVLGILGAIMAWLYNRKRKDSDDSWGMYSPLS